MKIEKYIDYRNEDLWYLLSNVYTISFKRIWRNHAEININQSNVTIYYPFNFSSSSLTHELLHLWLRNNGINFGLSFNLLIIETPLLYDIISERLIGALWDFFDHIKMYPKYISLGYSKHDFLSDNDVNKLTPTEANDIRTNFRRGGALNTSKVDLFIGKFFATKADVSSNYDYSRAQEVLRNTDEELYEILNKAWNEWVAYDHTTDSSNDNSSYDSIIASMLIALENWYSKNK